MRNLYYLIVQSHPRAFRIRFGKEMMSIFDEQRRSMSGTELMVDGLRSFARQWLRNSVFWSLTGAVSISGLQAWWIARVLQKASTSGQKAAGVADKHSATISLVVVFSFLGMATAVSIWNVCFMRGRAVRSRSVRTWSNSDRTR